jgi:hypothetical protein
MALMPLWLLMNLFSRLQKKQLVSSQVLTQVQARQGQGTLPLHKFAEKSELPSL